MSADRRMSVPWMAIATIAIVGASMRAYGVLQADFPLNDGGLFYQMVLDLQRTMPALPETTTYNGIGAPFTYPPLAFYVGALLEPGLGVDVLRVVPVVAAVLTIPAFYLVARSVLGSELTAIAATGVFAVMPRTFEWLTMGGGLTRAPGLLLALVAIWLTHRVVTGGGWRWAVATGIAGGLVALTHPQAALFTVLSAGLLVVWRARGRPTAIRLGVSVGIAVVVALPWLIALLSRDGLAAMVSAGGTQPGPISGLFTLLAFNVSGSLLFDVVGLVTGIGLVISVLRGRWLLPLWLVLVLVLDARGGGTYASVPASMLAGQAFVDLLLRPFWRDDQRADAGGATGTVDRPSLAAGILGTVLIAAAIIDAFGSQLAPEWPGRALRAEQREAIEAGGRAAPNADVLVVSGRFWAVDATAEWFPVLAEARSVATVQGHEWMGSAEFTRRARAAEALRVCVTSGPECLDTWADEWGYSFSHVFVPKGPLAGNYGAADCCEGLRLLLEADEDYELVVDQTGGALFAKRDG